MALSLVVLIKLAKQKKMTAHPDQEAAILVWFALSLIVHQT